MVFTVPLRVLLLGIVLLSYIQSVVNEDVDIETLSRIQKFFHCNYENNCQYAVAINVPKEQCQSGFRPKESNFLTQDPSERVEPYIKRNSMNVYRGAELIAAGFATGAHSEHLLMNPPNNSPLTDLMNRRRNGCVVFYTLNSPCMKSCLDRRSRKNIIGGLDDLRAYQGIKAFVYTHIYRDDQNNQNLRNALQQIADRVPLYRCKFNVCTLCGQPGSNIPVNSQCLT